MDEVVLKGIPAAPGIAIGREGSKRLVHRSLRFEERPRGTSPEPDDESLQTSQDSLLSLAKLPKLRELNIRDTRVTERGVLQIQQALPDCRIDIN